MVKFGEMLETDSCCYEAIKQNQKRPDVTSGRFCISVFQFVAFGDKVSMFGVF